MGKATVDEIRKRFDNDVENFSSLNGQISLVGSKISLELATESAKRLVPNAINLLDVGSGAGNYTLKMLSKLPNLNCTLVDLSKAMLDRAFERVSGQTKGEIYIVQDDIRNVELRENFFDIILSATALHHLRDDADWESVFSKLYKVLKPNGCIMISDLILQNDRLLTNYMFEMYSDYLKNVGDDEFCLEILDSMKKEDTPRSLEYQLNLMKKVGFEHTEILHKNICFAVFGAVK
jgi:tRNA (cmo5U34)-methyltransferase